MSSTGQDNNPNYLADAQELILKTYNVLYYGEQNHPGRAKALEDLCRGAMGLGQVALDQKRRIDALEKRLATLESARD